MFYSSYMKNFSQLLHFLSKVLNQEVKQREAKVSVSKILPLQVVSKILVSSGLWLIQVSLLIVLRTDLRQLLEEADSIWKLILNKNRCYFNNNTSNHKLTMHQSVAQLRTQLILLVQSIIFYLKLPMDLQQLTIQCKDSQSKTIFKI
jgi:hypothetical protein